MKPVAFSEIPCGGKFFDAGKRFTKLAEFKPNYAWAQRFNCVNNGNSHFHYLKDDDIVFRYNMELLTVDNIIPGDSFIIHGRKFTKIPDLPLGNSSRNCYDEDGNLHFIDPSLRVVYL